MSLKRGMEWTWARATKMTRHMQATLQTSNSQILVSALAKVKFSATQANGSTDAGKVKDKLFLVLYFDPHAKDGKVHVRDTILMVREPEWNTKSLFECFTNTLTLVGVSNWEENIGFGCDGTSVNIYSSWWAEKLPRKG